MEAKSYNVTMKDKNVSMSRVGRAPRRRINLKPIFPKSQDDETSEYAVTKNLFKVFLSVLFVILGISLYSLTKKQDICEQTCEQTLNETEIKEKTPEEIYKDIQEEFQDELLPDLTKYELGSVINGKYLEVGRPDELADEPGQLTLADSFDNYEVTEASCNVITGFKEKENMVLTLDLLATNKEYNDLTRFRKIAKATVITNARTKTKEGRELHDKLLQLGFLELEKLHVIPNLIILMRRGINVCLLDQDYRLFQNKMTNSSHYSLDIILPRPTTVIVFFNLDACPKQYFNEQGEWIQNEQFHLKICRNNKTAYKVQDQSNLRYIKGYYSYIPDYWEIIRVMALNADKKSLPIIS